MTFEAAGFRIAGEYANGADAVEGAPVIRPDLIVLDFAMPVMNGIEAAPLLRQRLPTVPIILFTLFGRALSEERAKAAGITSIVLPTLGLCEKVRALASRRRWNCRQLFPSGSSPLKHVRIASTPDTVRSAHAAAIVEVERDENGVISGPVAANKKRKRVQTPGYVTRCSTELRSNPSNIGKGDCIEEPTASVA